MNIPRIKKINYNINFVVSYTNQFHRFGTHIFGLFIDCNVFIILREYVDRHFKWNNRTTNHGINRILTK